MQINKITNINFKANYFRVDKIGRYYNVSLVTDNEENLGKEPILQFERKGKLKELPMAYDGKYYTTEIDESLQKYRIFYKDSGKYERNGEYQVINPLYYAKIATKADREFNHLPLEQPIAKGEVEGKVFVNTFDIQHDIPAILILDEVSDEEDLVLKVPENVHGVITSQANVRILDHIANLVRNQYQVLSIVLDEDKFNNLKKQEGKYLSISNESGLVNYKEIELTNTEKAKTVKSVLPPQLENVDRLLTFDELTPQNCGNKGYRLGVIKKLIESGQLKNICLPKGFVIPEGYINKYKKYLDIEEGSEEWKNRIIDGIYAKDTENKIKELDMPRKRLIIRSNYNTEDLGDFSSAGIYCSKSANAQGSIIDEAVYDVIGNPPEFSDIAKTTHAKYGINDKNIQPSVIVQERIDSDYMFTVYSDDGNNNMIIQLSNFMLGHLKPSKAQIKYNKNTKELTLENSQAPFAKYLIDEKGKIVDEEHEEDSITKNREFLTPLLGIVTSGAAVLEKFFNHPQDIEGGITKDGKVFFWQARDIVAKAVNRI